MISALGLTRRLAAGLGALSAVAVVAIGGSASGASTASSGMATTSGPSPSQLAPIHGKYAPKIKPSNFVARVDNPLWPLKPGTTFHYQGVRGSTPQTDNETVTHRTKRIIGINA